MRFGRKVTCGVAALSAAALPFGLSTGVAHAESYDKQVSQNITFKTGAGRTVTCVAYGTATRDRPGTSGPYRGSAGAGTSTTNDLPDPDCERSFVEMVITYRNNAGQDEQSTITGINFVSWNSNDVGYLVVQHRVDFLNCDSQQSTTCSLQFTTAPK